MLSNDVSIIASNIYDDDINDTQNPFQNYWLEGDSLAPPCQSEIDIINHIFNLFDSYLIKNESNNDDLNINTNVVVNRSSIIFPYKVWYDLGCGDGRICIEATKRYGCNSIGCEIELHLIEKFKRNVNFLSLEEKVTIIHDDLIQLTIHNQSVITIYLLPESIELIKNKLIEALQNDCVIIFITWGIKGLNPKSSIICGYANNTSLYLYDKSCLNIV